MTTAADVLVEGLRAHGVTHLFGMPGSHSTAIYDALHRLATIRTLLIRNEQAAAFAADGFARVTARPGVVCTTAGPGATNALTGIAEAWADSIPVLLLSGQVNARDLDRECGNYHELDLEAVFRPVTKWAMTVRRPEDVSWAVGNAFQAMTTGRPRPAALFLPQDLLRGDASPSANRLGFSQPGRPIPPASEVQEAAAMLAGSSRPIILAGGGAVWSGAGESIERLARRLNAPVITTLNGKGILDERHQFSLGHARSPRASAALLKADAMLALGCRFTEVLTDWRRMRVPPRLIHVDLEPSQIGANYHVAIGIVGDARTVVDQLLASLPDQSDQPGENHPFPHWWSTAEPAERPHPEWLIETLRASLPETAVVFTDACEIGYRMQAEWTAYGPRQFFYPSNFITLGWAFPAALGAAAAVPGPVVSVSGDGGFLMTAQELATAARYRLPVIAVIHNDSTFGAIKNIQQRVHQGRYLDVDLNNPDFPALAASFGVPGCRATCPAELAEAVRQALQRQGPTLIEVPDRWRFLRDLAVPLPSDP
jgi:thiamine pyrophosphate-dependent acetolactate synthase large subunit-like protein